MIIALETIIKIIVEECLVIKRKISSYLKEFAPILCKLLYINLYFFFVVYKNIHENQMIIYYNL